MRRVAAVLVLISSTMVVTAAGAAAYESTGYDPDDREILISDPDIASTTRRVWTSEHGRFLSIEITAYEDFGDWWSIDVRLDSRRGRRVDFIMNLQNRDHGGTSCTVYKPDSGNVHRRPLRQSGDEVSCRVAIRHVESDKRIRWKLISTSGYDGGETDYAPNNRAWYT